MPKGQNIILANSTGTLITAPNASENQSFAILNPNDGIVYATVDGAATPTNWDWKLPSQSYGLFPGPWQSVGLYFLDQSGAGRQGELTLYASDQKLIIPDIKSIGRALQAQLTTMDVTQGTQPANPP